MKKKNPNPIDLSVLFALAVENEDIEDAFERCRNDDQAWEAFIRRGRFFNLQLLLSLQSKFEELTPEATEKEKSLHRVLMKSLRENAASLERLIDRIPDKNLQMQIAVLADEMFEECAHLGKFATSLPFILNSQNIKRTEAARTVRGGGKQKRQNIIRENYKGELRADSKCVRSVRRQLEPIFLKEGLKLPSEKTLARDISDILSERP